MEFETSELLMHLFADKGLISIIPMCMEIFWRYYHHSTPVLQGEIYLKLSVFPGGTNCKNPATRFVFPLLHNLTTSKLTQNKNLTFFSPPLFLKQKHTFFSPLKMLIFTDF